MNTPCSRFSLTRSFLALIKSIFRVYWSHLNNWSKFLITFNVNVIGILTVHSRSIYFHGPLKYLTALEDFVIILYFVYTEIFSLNFALWKPILPNFDKVWDQGLKFQKLLDQGSKVWPKIGYHKIPSYGPVRGHWENKN